MKLAAMLIILALWIWYRNTEDSKPVTGKCHGAINALYFVLFCAAGVMVP